MKPTVSELLDLLNKPALMTWANKIGLQGIELKNYRKSSTKNGISLHKQVEMFVKDGVVIEDVEMQQKCELFFSDKKVLFSEESFETEYFKGRLDIMLDWSGTSYICDFKSKHRRLYLENKLQLTAYRMAFKCDRVAIITLPDFNVYDSYIDDFEPYEQILISLSKIYSLKNLLHEN
jgi:ATP-dependent exoDNAse (exonuclease V) beta subunit